MNPPPEITTTPGLLVTPLSPRSKNQFIPSQPPNTLTPSNSIVSSNLTYIKTWNLIKDRINRLSQIRPSRLSFHPSPFQMQQRSPSFIPLDLEFTDPTTILALAQMEQKQNLKKLKRDKKESDTERIQTTSRSKCQKALADLEKATEYRPSASFWIPQLEETTRHC